MFSRVIYICLVASAVAGPALAQSQAKPLGKVSSGPLFAETAVPAPPVPIARPTLVVPTPPVTNYPKFVADPKAASAAPIVVDPNGQVIGTPWPEPTVVEAPTPGVVNIADGRFKVLLGGAIIGDFIYSTQRPFVPDTPFYLTPKAPFGRNTNTFDVSAKQTTVFAAVTGPDVLGLQSGGMIMVNLYDSTIVADKYGLLPILAYGDLKNDDWRFAAGYQFDIFNPLTPTVLPFSFLGASGNVGLFRAQARVERFFRPADDTLVTFTVGISDPIPTTVDEKFRVSEDNGLPDVEARAAIGIGPVEGAGLDAHRPIEVGISALAGEIRTSDPARRVTANIFGLGADARIMLSSDFGVQGEAFMGQTLGTYAGGVLQTINPVTWRAIRASGGWVEGFYYWIPETVHSHLGYGVDDPVDRDVGAFGIVFNRTCYLNTIWDVTKAFRVAFQVSHLKTDFATLADNEGWVFHTQFQWKF